MCLWDVFCASSRRRSSPGDRGGFGASRRRRERYRSRWLSTGSLSVAVAVAGAVAALLSLLYSGLSPSANWPWPERRSLSEDRSGEPKVVAAVSHSFVAGVDR